MKVRILCRSWGIFISLRWTEVWISRLDWMGRFNEKEISIFLICSNQNSVDPLKIFKWSPCHLTPTLRRLPCSFRIMNKQESNSNLNNTINLNTRLILQVNSSGSSCLHCIATEKIWIWYLVIASIFQTTPNPRAELIHLLFFLAHKANSHHYCLIISFLKLVRQ